MSVILTALFLLAGLARPARTAGDAAQSPGPAAVLSRAQFRALLQSFVDKVYLKAFRHLGDERDFDHGHILFDARSRRPRAILYHTQEMAIEYPPASDFGYVDRDARNWLQWINEDRIENAESYQRKEFPRSPFWAWFVERRLPTLRRYHTILDKMLDPDLVGADTAHSQQWVFTRVDCAQASRPSAAPDAPMDILLPTGKKVCLLLRTA